jgi:hypothetical protein
MWIFSAKWEAIRLPPKHQLKGAVTSVAWLWGLSIRVILILLVLSGANLNARTYETLFPLAENPISEGDKWINGQTRGLDWSNVSTTPGFARGEQLPGTGNYNDSVALVAGPWGANQTVQTTVRLWASRDDVVREVEIRLRSTVTPHSSTGYEIFWSARPSDPYLRVARWNGPLNNYRILGSTTVGVQLTDGDRFAATIVGGTVTVYINGVRKLQLTDPNPLPSGDPGIGFYLANSRHNPAPQAEYGFCSFTATDDPVVTNGPIKSSIASRFVKGLLASFRFGHFHG